MTRRFSTVGYRQDDETLAKAKGKNEVKFDNEIFAAVNDLFYEFGIIKKPGNNEEKKP